MGDVLAGLHRCWTVNWSRLHKACGGGVLLLADGAQHVGHFAGGRADGPGFYLTPKGLAVQGSWKQNLRVGAFVSVNAQGQVFHEVYGEDGKRTSRKRAEEVATGGADGQVKGT